MVPISLQYSWKCMIHPFLSVNKAQIKLDNSQLRFIYFSFNYFICLFFSQPIFLFFLSNSMCPSENVCCINNLFSFVVLYCCTCIRVCVCHFDNCSAIYFKFYTNEYSLPPRFYTNEINLSAISCHSLSRVFKAFL